MWSGFASISAHLDDVVGIRLDQRLGGEEAEVELERRGHALDDADRLRHAELLQLGTERLLLAVDLRASRGTVPGTYEYEYSKRPMNQNTINAQNSAVCTHV